MQKRSYMSRLFARPKVLLAALAAAGLSFIPAAPEKAEAGPPKVVVADSLPMEVVSDGPLRVSLVAVEKGSGFTTPQGVLHTYTYRVSVENVSGKVVRGYALRSVPVTGPASVGLVYPDADRQTLGPWEKKVEMLVHTFPDWAASGSLRVTVDYVNFGDGTTWGSNQEHDAFFIRR